MAVEQSRDGAALPAAGGINGALEIRSAGHDAYSAIRYLHVAAFRHANAGGEAAELEAFRQHAYSRAYIDTLARADVLAAWLGSELVGTAAWVRAEDQDATARIFSLFVAPAVGRMGIGRRLVHEIEARAYQAGYRSFSAKAKGGGVTFFQRLGYALQSHGAQSPFVPGGDGPTAFMRKTLPRLAVTQEAHMSLPGGRS